VSSATSFAARCIHYVSEAEVPSRGGGGGVRERDRLGGRTQRPPRSLCLL
jgi:hypothetical protein